LLRLPDNFIESFDAAVKMIWLVINGQLIDLAIESELAFGDTVPVAADDGPHVWSVAMCVAVRGVKSEDNVVEPAGPIRHEDRGDDSAVRNRMNFDAVCVLQHDSRLLRATGYQPQKAQKPQKFIHCISI